MDRRTIENNLLSEIMSDYSSKLALFIDQKVGTESLVVRGILEDEVDFFDDITISLKYPKHTISEIWKSRKAFFIPDLKKSKLAREFSRHFDKNTHKSAIEYIEKRVKSVGFFPILIGEEILALIVFFSHKYYAFNDKMIRATNKLLIRARWVLKAADIFEQRKIWEYSFAHEIRSSIQILRESIATLERTNPSCTHINNANRYITRLFDITDDFMDLHRNIVPDEKKLITNIYHEIDELKKHYSPEIRINRQEVIISPKITDDLWKVNLIGSPNYYRRILRVIFENAIKYGEENTKIYISCRIDKSFFKVRIQNYGTMTNEENELKFVPFQKPKIPTHDGAHVGLSVARKIALSHNGDIELCTGENETGKYVVSHLIWPLTKERD
jgi:signal transduction histidine kinase